MPIEGEDWFSWRVGNGSSVRFWRSCWIEELGPLVNGVKEAPHKLLSLC